MEEFWPYGLPLAFFARLELPVGFGTPSEIQRKSRRSCTKSQLLGLPAYRKPLKNLVGAHGLEPWTFCL
jgi:hypothetical protein